MKKTIILFAMLLGSFFAIAQPANRLGGTAIPLNSVLIPTNVVVSTQDTLPNGTYDLLHFIPLSNFILPSTNNITGLQTTLTNLTNSISALPAAMTTHTVTRSLNTNYTVTTTREAYVDYDIDISTAVSLLSATQASTVYLEWTTNGGTTWNLEDQARNNQALSVSITIGLTTINTVKVTGFIPAGARTRIRTSGTGTVTYFYGKERY